MIVRNPHNYQYLLSLQGIIKQIQIVFHLLLCIIQAKAASLDYYNYATPSVQTAVLVFNMIAAISHLAIVCICVYFWIGTSILTVFEHLILVLIILIYTGIGIGNVFKKETELLYVKLKTENFIMPLTAFAQILICVHKVSRICSRRGKPPGNLGSHQYEMSFLAKNDSHDGVTRSEENKNRDFESNHLFLSLPYIAEEINLDIEGDIAEEKPTKIKVYGNDGKESMKKLTEVEGKMKPSGNQRVCATYEASESPGSLSESSESDPERKKANFKIYEAQNGRNCSGSSLLPSRELSFQEETLMKLRESLKPLRCNFKLLRKFK